MRTYAISFPSARVAEPVWRQALSRARIKAIELSNSLAPTAEEQAARAAHLRPLVEKGELAIPSLHLPFAPGDVWAYTATDETERRRTVAAAKDFLQRHEGLGIQNITIHSGGEPNEDHERRAKMESMGRTLADLLPLVESWGASLNVELLPRTCIGNNEDELLAMIKPFPAETVNVCLDVNHLMGRYAELPEVIRKLGPRLRTLHLSDYDGVDECHWHVGLGIIDWRGVMAALDALPHDLLLILEITPCGVPGGRAIDPALHFRACAHDAFLLEHEDALAAMAR